MTYSPILSKWDVYKIHIMLCSTRGESNDYDHELIREGFSEVIKQHKTAIRLFSYRLYIIRFLQLQI